MILSIILSSIVYKFYSYTFLCNMLRLPWWQGVVTLLIQTMFCADREVAHLRDFISLETNPDKIQSMSVYLRCILLFIFFYYLLIIWKSNVHVIKRGIVLRINRTIYSWVKHILLLFIAPMFFFLDKVCQSILPWSLLLCLLGRTLKVTTWVSE